MSDHVGQFLQLTDFAAVCLVQIGGRPCAGHQGIADPYQLQVVFGVYRIGLVLNEGSKRQKISKVFGCFRLRGKIAAQPYIEFRMEVGHDAGVTGGTRPEGYPEALRYWRCTDEEEYPEWHPVSPESVVYRSRYPSSDKSVP